MRDYIVSGVPLRDPQGQWFIDYTRSSLTTELTRTLTGDAPYGYHGDAISRNGFFGTGRETIVLNLIGSNKDNYNALLKGFQGLFQRPEYPVVSAPQRSTLSAGTARQGQSFSVASDLTRQGTFRTVGTIVTERVDEAAARLTMIVENRLAFWMSTVYYTALQAITSTPVTIDLETILADSDAPVTDGLIRIKGPISAAGSVTVRDRDQAQTVKYNSVTALASTEYVVIDMATLSARLQTLDSWSLTTGTDVSTRLEKTGDGPMTFTPGDVVTFPSSFNYAGVITAAGHTSATTVEVRVRRSYLS